MTGKIQLIVLVLICLVCVNCQKEELDTFSNAQQQYEYAANYQMLNTAKIISRDNKDVLKSIIRRYELVVEFFPENKVFTPAAKKQIAMAYIKLNDDNKAIKYCESIINAPADNAYIHAFAYHKLGNLYYRKKKRDIAKKYWQECVNNYAEDKNEKIKKLVDECKVNLGLR